MNGNLYNAIFGENSVCQLLVSDICELTDTPEGFGLGRLRDAWLERVDGGYRIAVYTRNGGGNRACWGDPQPCNEPGCPGCTMSNVGRHPRYLSDKDDDFDCTYATIYFRPSAALQKILSRINPEMVEGPVDTDKRWTTMLGKLGFTGGD